MPRAVLLAFCGAALIAWRLGTAPAQGVDAIELRPTDRVAVVNVDRIFKESPRLRQLRKDLGRDFDAQSLFKKVTGEEISELKKRAEAANAAERETILEECRRKADALKARADELTQDFIARETKLNLDFYDDVRSEAEAYAEDQGIDLVLRTPTTSDAANPNDASVTGAERFRRAMTYINRQVVHNGLDAPVDITAAVIDRMKASGTF